MRNFILGGITFLVVAFVLVLATFYFGFFPVGADNGPLPMERALANMAVDAAMERNATQQANPVPDSPDAQSQGAKLYDRHCAACHGDFEGEETGIGKALNPRAPQFTRRVPDDADANLFWVIAHGIRMTGMPAFKEILKDDEMWTVLRFLKSKEGQGSGEGAPKTAAPAGT